MIRYSRGITFCIVLMLITVSGYLFQKSVYAACGGGDLSDACSTNFGLLGGMSALASGDSQSPSPEQPFLTAAGGLAYSDFQNIEAQARSLLARNIRFREDISPYRPNNNFNDLVRNFDAHSGFSAAYDDPSPEIGTQTLQQRIDQADVELRRARDLYAFLIVYAPVQRMRDDDNLSTEKRCSQTEDPNPVDPAHSGQVLAPVIDWCNFAARMRQSVREAAYLRLLFAQQFLVDALGLHFSAGSLIGGNAFVHNEVAKLEAAKYQFVLAERGLREATGIRLGSGCLVSNFYTQFEWALLSRAIQGEEEAQQQIASRLSYLDIQSVNDVAKAQAAAEDAFRTTTTNGYIKLISMSRLWNQVPDSNCEMGERPDGQLIAEMAVNLQDARTKAKELSAGRNVFGFDITFTPARPYHTAFGSTDKGLWEQAKEAADLALVIQQQTENAERVFDLNQQELTKAIIAINEKIDNAVQAQSGCDLQAFSSDADYYACIDEQIEETSKCDPRLDTFDACINRTTDGKPATSDCSNCVVLGSDLRQQMLDMRVAWLDVKAATTRKDNIVKRADTETMRNTKVKSSIFKGAQAASGYETAIVAANCCTLSTKAGATGIFPSFEESFDVNPGAFVEAVLRPLQMMRQAATDMQIEDANSEAVIRNFFFDLAEAQGEIESALAQYNSMTNIYLGIISQLQHDVFESKRQHAYAVANPANDPSYRMVRDSRRVELAQQLNTAARLAYMAARRAEYEYTARLSSGNFRISDIYKARTANDILIFLQNLDIAVSSLPGSVKDAETNQRDLTLSVAYHLLGLTDQYLRGQGVAEANLQAERQRRFRQWVTENTRIGSNGKPVLDFTFVIPAATDGLVSQMVQQDYDYFWLHKMAGIGQPKLGSNGLGVNIDTEQTGEFSNRLVRVSQNGQVSLRSFSGCIFDYRLVPPAAMLGLDFPSNQPTDVVMGIFNADVNGMHGNSTSGYSTPAFLGRPLASTSWQVIVNPASPDGIQPDLKLDLLTDIQLKLSTTYATRPSNTQPTDSQCVRIDF